MARATLTTRELNRATLARQLLLDRAEIPVPEAVERLGGLQAQEPKPPFIGLWTRLAGFREADLARALHDRAVVRATMMRGTLHLATASDYAAFRTPLQPMLMRAMASALRDRSQGLEPDAVLPVARELLNQRPRPFDELRTLLQEAFPDVNHRALGYAVRMLLPLVMVPTGERWAFPRVADFTLAESWLDRAVNPEQAPDDLVLRYLGAFGPASAADMQAWSGLGGIKAVLEGLRPRLESFADEAGRELFDLPDAPRPGESVPAPPRFLPEFDSLLLAHADRARVISDEHRPVVVTKNLRVRATFLLDGFVAGTWEIKRTRRVATLTVTPFAAPAQRDGAALKAEGSALLGFTDGDVEAHEVVVADPVPGVAG
ncbi:MAG TPA: winged helix DNA-binding domain-containing protein [Solirubrobacteraceae bacterium]|jgi:hypothetical protein|nr:winged helix DNA-binding domain-containing protein [Solirubrobacteraceae bacterium]